MIKHQGRFFTALLCLVVASSSLRAVPYCAFRSQASNSARELVGWAHEVNIYNDGLCEDYKTFALTFEYSRSFDEKGLARGLIGIDCLDNCECPTIKISGSRVADRGEKDWLADYFGLPTDFKSTVTLNPTIKTYLVDFAGYWGLDSWRKGLYFRVHAPVVHTRWNLNYCEEVEARGVASYDPGYFGTVSITRDRLNDDFFSYITACNVPDLGRTRDLNGVNDSGQVIRFEPLACSKWVGACDRVSKTALAEITLAFGYNFWQCDNYHAGFNLRAALPTGTRPDCKLFFEPIVGNGHHWEIGAGFTGHYTFWRGCNDDSSLGVYLDANFTHLFKDRQCRVFDLKNRCNSRYMLAIKLGQPVENLFAGTPPIIPDNPPSAQFQHAFTPVANITKTFVDVSVAIQTDVTLMFNYSKCNWGVDFGYNFWGRSCEKLRFDACDDCHNPLINNRRWALKGDAYVYGFTYDGVHPPNAPLSPSQSKATLFKGTNNFVGPDINTATNPAAGINGIGPSRNPGVDNVQLANLVSGAATLLDESPGAGGDKKTHTSLDPIFITPQDLDICAARTKGTSHKLFAYVGYTWEDNCGCYIPYFGVGGSAEWGNRNSCCPTDCDNVVESCSSDGECSPCGSDNDGCSKCALSQWALWLKAGVSFD